MILLRITPWWYARAVKQQVVSGRYHARCGHGRPTYELLSQIAAFVERDAVQKIPARPM